MGLNGTGLQAQGSLPGGAGPSALPHGSRPWYSGYMLALFEPDRSRMGERIRTAEQLILARERELFSAPAGLAEQQALNNALHALHALRACLGL